MTIYIIDNVKNKKDILKELIENMEIIGSKLSRELTLRFKAQYAAFIENDYDEAIGYIDQAIEMNENIHYARLVKFDIADRFDDIAMMQEIVDYFRKAELKQRYHDNISFMLNDASGFRRIYLATGYTDLRRGMEGLASIIKFNFQLDPYQKDILFLFCGRRTDRIKGLVWEGDGFLLLYKRLELGAFNWPRTKEEALEITPEQYQYLMQGLEIVARHPIQEVRPDKIL